MKQLTNAYRNLALDYLKQEPEFNLFMIGDIEIYGMEDSHVSVYTSDDWDHGDFPYLLLSYMGKFSIYSHDENYDAKTVSGFLIEQGTKDVNGRDSLVQKLIPYLPPAKVKQTYLARLNEAADLKTTAFDLCCLTEAHSREIYELYLNVEELESYHRMSPEQALESIRQGLGISGRTYGLFVTDGDGRKRLVSIASTAAETSLCAMIIGVATLKEYRNHGYASAVVGRLCKDCIESGKAFLCLFYDNPAAGKIYQRIGFKELGLFTMLYINR